VSAKIIAERLSIQLPHPIPYENFIHSSFTRQVSLFEPLGLLFKKQVPPKTKVSFLEARAFETFLTVRLLS
jgi:hypothetical protein